MAKATARAAGPSSDPERLLLMQQLRSIEEATAIAEQQAATLARSDFRRFAEYVFTDSKRNKPLRQAAVHNGFQSAIDASDWVFAELPRDHGKTTQVVIRVLFWLGRNPNELIKIACETDRQAKARIREISEHIVNNERLHRVFPWLRPADVGGWTQHALYVQRGVICRDASVEAYGIGAGVIGGRATKLVFDDVTRPKSVRSEAAREEVKQAFYGVWLPMIEEPSSEGEGEDDDPDGPEGGRSAGGTGESKDGDKPPNFDALPDGPPDGELEVYDRTPRGGRVLSFPDGKDITEIVSKVVWIGTPWHNDDLHCELKRKAGETGWLVFSRAVGDEWSRQQATLRGEPADDFSPVWPERWERGRLISRCKRIGTTHFARGYQLRPISDEDKVWLLTDFRTREWDEAPADEEILATCSAWDFAFTTNTRNDWTAYCCLAVDSEGNFHVFRAAHFRKGFKAVSETMVRWWRRDRADVVGFESVQAQAWMGEHVGALAPLPLRPLKPKGDKYSRAIQTQPYVEGHRVYFYPGTEDLQREMDQFPLGAHDDLADVFVYAVLLAVDLYLADGVESDDDADEAQYEDDDLRISVMGGAKDRRESGERKDRPGYRNLKVPEENASPSVLDRVRWG